MIWQIVTAHCVSVCRFPNLGILHVTKKKVPEVLLQRLIQQRQLHETSLDNIGNPDACKLTEGLYTWPVRVQWCVSGHLCQPTIQYVVATDFTILRACNSHLYYYM